MTYNYHTIFTSYNTPSAQFNVYTREAGAGCLSIAMEGPSKADITFEDAKDESCLVTYSCDTPGMLARVCNKKHQI